ncbi:trafficking particle complex subunit 4 [Brachionus plicatilis]|uniref:Trafficking protein particle complex subunit n=1 Tax=Brachionus plicatilis TaxID=10195 RepID=A0A3M7TA50_BRAPC|nr:trafficking particle complex subunit 4 [Brachionus plicatilis]
MAIYSFFILNKNAGMVYSREFTNVKIESEKVYNYPLEVKLDKLGCIKFGARDPVKVGHVLISVNGQDVYFDKMDKNRLKMKDMKGAEDVFEYLNNVANYPVQLKFGRAPLTTNDKLVLTGRFFGLYSLAWQLSPVAHSSGIEQIETDQNRLYCFHTITGFKFIAITDSRQQNVENFLRKSYEIFSDYGLKNPFYLNDQPIKSDLFDFHIQLSVDNIDRL